MRLIYFIPLLSTIGGQERTLIDKANYLVSRGHEVMFVTYEHEGTIAYHMSESVKHVDLNCHVFSIYKYPVYIRPWKLIQLRRHFRMKMYEIRLNFHPDVIVIAIPNTENFICDVISVAKDIPIVIESHLAYGHQVIKRGATERLLYLFSNPLKAIRKSKLLIALTQGDADCWCKIGITHLKVIPNPVTFCPKSLPQKEKQKGRIICVGRLTRQKRFDRLIIGFSLIAEAYPSWHVDIYGEGEEKEELLRLINDLGLMGRIYVHQPIYDIYFEYLHSQFFVMSSDFEGFGLVVIEAMACGIPVVATNCPYGPSEIIDDGKTGLLAKMDEKDLAKKMEWMITHEEERKWMGHNAYKAVDRYRKEYVMPLWEKAYLSVI